MAASSALSSPKPPSSAWVSCAGTALSYDGRATSRNTALAGFALGRRGCSVAALPAAPMLRVSRLDPLRSASPDKRLCRETADARTHSSKPDDRVGRSSVDGATRWSPSAGARFRWVPGWGDQGTERQLSVGMAHHGIAVTSDQRVVSFGVDEPMVEIRHPNGKTLAVWRAPVATGHGLRIAVEDGRDTLWIADNGDSWVRLNDGSYGTALPDGTLVTGTVVQLTLSGEELRRVPVPDHPAYEAGSYCPTDVAVDEPRFGGDGSVWVADGYGQSLVHRFDVDGQLLLSLSGEEGLGRFDQPHSLHIDRRAKTPELYVTDRGNSRIQVFDLSGRFRRGVGVGSLISPGGIASLGSGLIVAELDGRVVLLDARDQLVGILGYGDVEGRARPGWPNAVDRNGNTVRPSLEQGSFNTPHGIATDQEGNVYLSEWVIGGRLIKLEPV